MTSHRLPLRFLTATSVAGLTMLVTPPASAQGVAGAATAEQSDAPEPRFGMFRDPTGYEGAENRDPADYNGRLLRLDDEEMILSLWKGIDGTEALEETVEDDPDAGTPASDIADAPVKDGRFALGKDVQVFLNGRRANVSDLREGDSISVRGLDPDGKSVRRIVALRTDDVSVAGPMNVTPDLDPADDLGGSAAEPASPAEVDPSIARAAESGITSPGGSFQPAPDIEPVGDTKENLESGNRGVPVRGTTSTGLEQGDEGDEGTAAPGFGFAVADSPGEGVLVADVMPGGPAAEAGVRQGDFLTRLDGKTVNDPGDVRDAAKKALNAEDPEPVPATVWRDGEEENVEMTPSQSATDHYEPSVGNALGMANRVGMSPKIGARVRDSEDTGVEVLAGAAIGALAAQSESERGGLPARPVGGMGYYGAPAGAGFYGANALTGLDIYDFAYGYGAGPVAAGTDPRTQRLLNNRIAARNRAAAANAALGVDAEDQYVGQRPEGAAPQGGDGPHGGSYDRLLPNDRIIGVNNRPIDDRAELNRVLRSFDGDSLTLNVVRDGDRVNLKLPKRAVQK